MAANLFLVIVAYISARVQISQLAEEERLERVRVILLINDSFGYTVTKLAILIEARFVR